MALDLCTSFEACARGLGYSPSRLKASLRKTDTEIRDALAVSLQRHDAKRSTREVMDAATNFTTNYLAKVLEPVMLENNTRYLFVPGRTDGDPLLPVMQNVDWGERSVEWTTVALTGEATFFGPGAIKDLRRVDSADDQSQQFVTYYGVRYGWDQFELWQAAALNRRVQQEQQVAASMAMAETFEQVGGFGYNKRKIPGMFNHGNAVTFDLPISFGNPAITYEQALEQLCTIDLVWDTANPRRAISGVVMPKSHVLNLKKKFIGANDEGGGLWKWALDMFPWLANIKEDNRMLTASDSNGSQWTLWSSDAMDLFREASDPMVFGPFDDELETNFVVIQQDAGVICRRSELLFRVQMPA